MRAVEKAESGRWVTIGGQKGADGRRHGGSPVYVENGRITRGHPSLTGKKIGALKDEADDGSHRRQLNQSRNYDAAVWRKKARKAGHDPEHLDQLAAEIKAHHDAFAGERRELLKRARASHRANGFGELSNLASRAAGGRIDANSLRGFDQTAERIAAEYPHHFRAETGEHGDHLDQLFEMLSHGDPEPMSHAEAYEAAFNQLGEPAPRPKRGRKPAAVDDDPFSFNFGANAIKALRTPWVVGSPLSQICETPPPGRGRAARVLLKSVPGSGSYTGALWGKYFLNGKVVTREEYLAARPGGQGRSAPAKPAAGPSVSRHNPDLDTAFGAAPEKPAPKPQAAGRHNPDLDAAFDPQPPAPAQPPPPPPQPSGARPMPSTPPELPHQRTQQAALAAANALSQAVRGGDRTAARTAHERAIRALDAHLKEGLRAIDRMAASRYGGGPRAERAARQAKQAFKAKVQAVARRLTALRTGVGKSLSLPPLAFLPPAPDDVWNACTGVHDMQPDLVPWRVKQVADDLLAYLVPEADFKCDGGKLVVHGTATTDRMDPQRDIVLPVGGDLGRHQKNPIVLLNHRKDLPGIARTKSPDGEYTVRLVNDHRLDTSNYFDQHSKLSVQAFRLIESGALGGLSIGFVPKPGGVQKALGADRHPVFVYSQWELLEVTHAPIGVNPDAVVHAIEKGFGAGEALLPELKDLLIPYVPEPKPLVRSGWEPQPMSQPEPKEKAMGTTDDTAGGTLTDDSAPADLTPTTEVLHTVHAGAESLIAYITQAMKRVEAPATREALDEILTHAGKILDCCQETHAGHTADHPDQPPLPDPSDLDRDDDSDAAMKAFARRALWVHNKAMAEARRELENAEVRTVREVADELREDARDARFDLRTRKRFKAMAGRLAAVKGGHVPAVPDPDEVDWSPVAAEIEKRLA